MRTRKLVLDLYADDEGTAWVRGLVGGVVRARGGRVVRWEEQPVPLPGGVADEVDGMLAEQWAWEHPGQDPGGRRTVRLRVGFRSSLRVGRAVRGTVLRLLCPEGDEPHVCRVPWSAG